jgi:ABC-2 type transport system permease protein
MTSLLGLLARRYAAWTTTWLFIVGILVVVTLPSYASTYPDEAARRVAVELAQNNAATTLLYGRLPDPGSPGQLFVWEIGTFVTLLVAVLGVLMTVRLTRVAEQAGTIEIVRSAGLGRLAPLTATFVVAVVGAILGLVSAAGVGFRAGQVDGVDWTGSLAFGSVVALTFLLMALITARHPRPTRSHRLGSQGGRRTGPGRRLRPTSRGRNSASPLAPVDHPLGLRATVEPFTSNSPVPLAVSSVVVILLAVVATALERSRELGGSILRVSTTRVRRVRVSSPLGLAWRLRRATTVWWVAGIALGGALFTAMGSSVVETARQGQLSGGFLEAQLAGGDPVSASFGYTGTVVAIVVVASGILSTLEAVTEERRGPGEYLRATGTSPARVLAGHLGVALIGSALALGSTAALIAIVAPQTVSGPGVSGVSGEAFQQVIGQWSGVLVLMGPAILLAGWSPRLAWLGWIPYAAGVVLALLGTLLGLPQALIDLGPFDPAHGVLTPLIRLTVFAITVGVGLWAVGRRDLTPG